MVTGTTSLMLAVAYIKVMNNENKVSQERGDYE